MRFLFNLFACLALTFRIVHASGFEGTSGTYVAGFIGRDFLIMGADSRITLSNVFGRSGYADDDCKLTILGDGAAFVNIGQSSVRLNGRLIFDGDMSAKEAYRLSNKDLRDAAQRWAIQLAEVIASNPLFRWNATNGIFFGFDKSGQTHMVNVGITTDGTVLEPQDLFWAANRSTAIISMSHPDLANLLLSTEEAKSIRDNPNTSETRKYSDLLHLLIKGMIEQRNAAGDNDIGGDAAILVLSRGQRPSWPYPTTACDKKQNQ
jgi:hypothetical protein